MDFKKNPVLTDVTYDAFPDGFYLCTTNMFFEELDQYMVIFQAVLDGLSSDHFESYFKAFFKKYNLVVRHTDDEIDTNFSGLVMDFSLAQRNGFIAAFEATFPVSRISANSLLKGCYHRWCQSIQWLVSYHAIVLPEKKTDFEDLTHIMYMIKGKNGFQLAVHQLWKEFPNAERWLDWWTHDGVAAMIFQSKEILKDQLANNATRTTNGIEAFHRDLYHVVQKKLIVDTLKQIFSYLQNTKGFFSCFDAGAKIDDTKKKPK